MIKNPQEELKRLQEKEKKLNKIIEEPGTFNKDYSDIYKELAEIKKPLEKLTRFFDLQSKLKETERLITEENAEISAIAKEDKIEIEKEISLIEKELGDIYKQNSKTAADEVIMEIRAGAGGNEAALFAQELLKMYSKFAEKNNWDAVLISESSTDLGGVKEAILRIKGKDSALLLKNESGVHRVQRIPETEKSGRIHTSTVSIAILPIIKESEITINHNDLKIDLFRASGPGGQNVNKVETAVRITHIPTGIMIASQSERSQAKNKNRAMEILRSKLYQEMALQQKQEVGQLRKEQIGSAERAEKIRTYNFPQDRITDHRLKKSWHNIESMMAGNIEAIVQSF